MSNGAKAGVGYNELFCMVTVKDIKSCGTLFSVAALSMYFVTVFERMRIQKRMKLLKSGTVFQRDPDLLPLCEFVAMTTFPWRLFSDAAM